MCFVKYDKSAKSGVQERLTLQWINERQIAQLPCKQTASRPSQVATDVVKRQGSLLTPVSAEGHDHLCARLVIPEVAILFAFRVGSLAVIEAGQLTRKIVKGAHSLAKTM